MQWEEAPAPRRVRALGHAVQDAGGVGATRAGVGAADTFQQGGDATRRESAAGGWCADTCLSRVPRRDGARSAAAGLAGTARLLFLARCPHRVWRQPGPHASPSRRAWPELYQCGCWGCWGTQRGGGGSPWLGVCSCTSQPLLHTPSSVCAEAGGAWGAFCLKSVLSDTTAAAPWELHQPRLRVQDRTRRHPVGL